MSHGSSRRVAIIGGGITGLAAAHRCLTRSETAMATVFEASDRLGGIIRTERRDGYVMELGPDSFITNKPGAIQLCEESRFSAELIPTDDSFRRSLVLHQGQPEPVPDGFLLMAPSNVRAIVESPVLSFGGKLRLLSESGIPRSADNRDETLSSFVTRRFGREALDRLVQPLVGGIYTSDPERLSLRATLPRFLDMENEFGSVIRATLAKNSTRTASTSKNESGARYGLFATAKNGLSSLVEHIVGQLSQSDRIDVRREAKVDRITAGDTGQWAISSNGKHEEFDEVIITLPAHQITGILADDDQKELCSLLDEIEYASSAIVVSGHSLSDFRHGLEAFGLVIPMIEGRKILAVSFSSRKFPGRAPEGHVLLRTFVGGAMQPELLEQTDSKISDMVNDELADILGMSRPPEFSQVVRYPKAMPQYHVGHVERVDRIEQLLRNQTGLHIAGSAYRGVGIPDSIASGRQAAEKALS